MQAIFDAVDLATLTPSVTALVVATIGISLIFVARTYINKSLPGKK